MRCSWSFFVAAVTEPWVIAWCAGAGTSSATPESLQLELVALRETLNSLDGATRPSGGLFLFCFFCGWSVLRSRRAAIR